MPIPLVERSEREMAQKIKRKVEAIRDVKSCRQVSVHMTGKKPDVEMTIELDNKIGFDDIHRIVSNVEREVKTVLPDARTTVQTEPFGSDQRDIWRLVKDVAEKVPGTRDVHNIYVQNIDGKLCVDFHLEVSANMTVKQAHNVSSNVERSLKIANPNLSEITVHLESASDIVSRELTDTENEIKLSIEHLVRNFPDVKAVHGIRVRSVGDRIHVVLQCHFDPNLSMGQAHEITKSIENAIRSNYSNIDRIDVHEEPA